jgi:arabinogalactan endo-1,4-beta-galactosidase
VAAAGGGSPSGQAAHGGAGGATGAPAGNGAADGGVAHTPSFYLGADITWVQADEARGASYGDPAPRDILQLLKAHGFNAVRLRTFVDPKAADGYDPRDGYGDLAHTASFGARIKKAGMALLVDFHYSDNWADPGKQCVPVAWQGMSDIDALAGAVHDYTQHALEQLIAAGAHPDLVQVGNEITAGMLLHRCDERGQPTGTFALAGSSASWTNLGKLLAAGARAVKEIDSGIQVMLHIDRGDDFDTSRAFIERAKAAGVAFDVFGESCYTAYQGTPSQWRDTFTRLAARFPELRFAIAEYGPEQRGAGDVMFELAEQRGLGTFNWEPTHSGAWNTGHALFDVRDNAYTATPDLSLYDAMKRDYADRL